MNLAAMAVLAVAAGAPAADGRALAASCTGCHAGPHALAFESPAALYESLRDWRRREDGALMARLARGYSDDELRQIADFLAGR